MKILLIGKNGQLGTELERQAKDFGFDIVSFSREELDITDYKKTTSSIDKYKPDIVINASAYHVVPECESNPAQAFLVNALAIKNLAEICENIGGKLVHYSTDYVFDGKKGKPYIEEDLPCPMQAYGISKVAGEHFALAYNSKSIVIRSSGVYGGRYGSKSKKGNFALNILKQDLISRQAGKKTLEVSSEQIVNPTYSVDLANATLKLIKKKNISGIYHLVNEGHCSWAEFSKEITKLVGSETKIIPVDRRGQSGGARRPLFSALKNARAANLGIKLPSWQDAIKRYIITLS
jgi:dTDP-4-dehydrorhamnose reductase